MPAPFRPRLMWLLTGPLIGAVAGAVVAFAILLPAFLLDGSRPPGPFAALASVGSALLASLAFGGLCGAAVGFLAGLPLIVLVGRHLPRRVARRRAFVLGVLLSPVAMTAVFWMLSGELLLDTAFRDTDAGELLPVLAASLLGGSLAAWVAPAGLPRPPS
ncbi:hypothetical protein [Nocardioides sp. P5_E3]